MDYVILVNNDNTLTTSQRRRIMQREKLVNTLWFLVAPEYNGYDMSEFTVSMEYVLPCSRRYKTEILELNKEGYKEFLKYTLPFNTELTSEAGEIEVQLTFVCADLDEKGNDIQRVRKTSACKINIVPLSNWSDIIPDSALSSLDQRLIKLDAAMKAMNGYLDVVDNNMVDDLVYNDTEETLQLSAKGKAVGSKVSVRDMLDEGIPVVDMDSTSGSDSGSEDDTEHGDNCNCGCNCENDVVEFGYSETTDTTEENDVVEF